ncbi:malonyl CoA-acyl carrier protein transacylase [Planctomycetales bacterium]|nr:malonyl CoA-acyl carrier protein transacylase [Planctomycetales bacterium]GHT03266.1 malonyl CoA-acyl carrier protein transacylase [Planctomycetales bacterium]
MNISGYFLFPGQGAQVVGMAKDCFDTGGYAKSLFEEASDVLGFSLEKLVFAGDEAELARTENCQPALLVASLAYFETLRERCNVEVTGASGHSLGEYTALVAIGALDFAAAVKLVRLRGELMEKAAAGKGGMTAIIGLADETVEQICADAGDAGVIVAANYNCPKQLVVSGEIAALEKAEMLAKKAGAKIVTRLKVGGAFHSPLMEAARASLADALRETQVCEIGKKFINNADAKILREPESLRESLARQLVSPVRWTASMQLASSTGDKFFYECGPGKVCQGLMKRIDATCDITSVNSMAAIEDIEQQ